MKQDKPIITSLLDTDIYKFRMMQGYWMLGDLGQAVVDFELINRSDLDILSLLDYSELQENLEHVFNMKLGFKNKQVLEGLGFDKEWLHWLSTCSTDDMQMEKDTRNGLFLRVHGPIRSVTIYETFIMSIIQELIHRKALSALTKTGQDEVIGQMRDEHIDKMKKMEKDDLKFVEFGTRRRARLSWQKWCLEMAQMHCPNQLLGTSNVMLANELGLECKGTQAHEWYMLFAGAMRASMQYNLRENPEDARRYMILSQREAIDSWLRIWPDQAILLPDTYTTKVFFEDIMEHRHYIAADGFRQDSGDPIQQIAYMMNKVNTVVGRPNTKVYFPSDSLEHERMWKIKDTLGVNGSGWGTNFSNDSLFLVPPIVVKLVRVHYHGRTAHVAKVSDNPAKATGDDANWYKRAFGVEDGERIEVKY